MAPFIQIRVDGMSSESEDCHGPESWSPTRRKGIFVPRFPPPESGPRPDCPEPASLLAAVDLVAVQLAGLLGTPELGTPELGALDAKQPLVQGDLHRPGKRKARLYPL